MKTRMIGALLLILAPYFVFTSYRNYQNTRDVMRSNIITRILPLTSDNVYSEVQADIVRPIFVSSLMSNDTFLKDWVLRGEKNPGEIRKYLHTIRSRYGFFSSFFVSEKTGRYYYYGGILKKISPDNAHDRWYYSFIAKNIPRAIDVDTDEATSGTLTVFINHRISDYRGRLLGVTGVGLKMQDITTKLQSYRNKYGCNVYFVDEKGVIQAHNDMSLIMKTSIRSHAGMEKVAQSILDGRSEQQFFKITRDESDIHLLSRYIPEFNWHLLVELDESRHLERLRWQTFFSFFIGLLLSAVIILISLYTINHFQKKMSRLVVTDELTGAGNRREIELHFQKFKSRKERNMISFSMILFDVDHFKEINDRMGHLSGDRVLVQISDIIRRNMRITDSFFRWGGDEFMILFEGADRKAVTFMKRVMKEINRIDVTGREGRRRPDDMRAAISCGIAQYHDNHTLDNLLASADSALYRAKRRGRNRIVVNERG
jgi:diguanylate cyclase (GGDEF)-like protein